MHGTLSCFILAVAVVSVITVVLSALKEDDNEYCMHVTYSRLETY